MKRHWKGPDVNWNVLVKAALLHDIGSIVKFDLDEHKEFLGKEASKIKHWKKKQEKIISKYGKDDHEVTMKMLDELKVLEKIKKIVLNKSFGNAIEVVASSDYSHKILLYADLRVTPKGISTMEARLKETTERTPQYAESPDLPELLGAAKRIEKQIQDSLDIPVSEINFESASGEDKKLLKIKL